MAGYISLVLGTAKGGDTACMIVRNLESVLYEVEVGCRLPLEAVGEATDKFDANINVPITILHNIVIGEKALVKEFLEGDLGSFLVDRMLGPMLGATNSMEDKTIS